MAFSYVFVANAWVVDDAYITFRTVDNFIVRLRRHFELDPQEPRHFLSIRGAGYRFLPEPEPDAE